MKGPPNNMAKEAGLANLLECFFTLISSILRYCGGRRYIRILLELLSYTKSYNASTNMLCALLPLLFLDASSPDDV